MWDTKRKLRLALFVFGVFLAVRQANAVYLLWRTGDKITTAEEKLAASKAENQRLKQQLDYAQTPDFIEREAREKLGYAKPGEIILIVPTSPVFPSPTPTPKLANWQHWKSLWLR